MSADRTTEASPPAVGLSSSEAVRLLGESGANVLATSKPPSLVRRFAANLVHLFALLLWGGAALAAGGGMPELSAAIAVVVVVNAAFATFQEHRADRASEALRLMLPQVVRVRRDGVTAEVPAEDVVPGDVLLLQAGDRVSADADILVNADLRLDESALTGESWPVQPKDVVRAGTYVTAGAGEVQVTATGMRTELGRIAKLSTETKGERSPLEKELDRVTRFVAALSIGIGVSFFLVAGLIGMGLKERFVFAIGVMVANVPEGLLPTVTLSLAMATQRMSKRNALVRKLSAVETLGETTVICTDKTGTLTENELTAVRLWTLAGSYEVESAGYEPAGRFLRGDAAGAPAAGEVVAAAPLADLLRCGLLCNDSRLVHEGDAWTVIGDPTEGALVVLGVKGGLDQEAELARSPRLTELPFDSTRKRMTTIHEVAGGSGATARIAYVKGAPEELVPLSLLEPAERERAVAAALAMQQDGLRVLALARRSLPAVTGATAPTSESVEHDLELLGLVGMIDPPRPEVADAVARCRAAGIRIVMVTGDAGPTAEAIGRRIGLVGDLAHVVSGSDMAKLDDAALTRAVAEREVIFARIDPEQKLRIARVLRAAGEVVAMTGDGVNDAPALKEADIGIAMGRGGSDVARETADMILLDDNFASIVAAVEEGRAVYDNIRRFVSYHFCSNVGELVPFLVWGLSGGRIPLPLVVMQVLAIDLGTDMLPAIALGTEPAEPGTMSRPPRPRSERLLNRRVLARVYGFVGLLEGIAGISAFLFSYVLHGWVPFQPLPAKGAIYLEATTMTQTAIVMGQVGAGFAMRTNRLSIRAVGFFSNRFLLVGVAFELVLAAALIYVPGLNGVFHQKALGLWAWAFLLIWPPIVLGAEELRKAVLRRRDAAR